PRSGGCVMSRELSRYLRCLFLTPILFLSLGCGSKTSAPLRIAAASDLQTALPKLADRFEAKTGIALSLTFGATGQLSEQIKAGAPFDVLLAANESFVSDLAKLGLIRTDSVSRYARGSLVLVVHGALDPSIRGLDDLSRGEVKKIALANPVTAPYGK